MLFNSVRFASSSISNFLEKFLVDKIRASGPITVAEFMQLALAAPKVGYYQREDKPIFNATGDFITSPELSQMFGEVVSAWCMHSVWKMGHKGPWQLVELGPGTGQLAYDALNCLKRFREDKGVSLHLVEVSKHLASVQRRKLCADKHLEGLGSVETIFGPHVTWYSDVKQVPCNFSVFICHEFFDAMPVYKFQRTDEGWRELLVGLCPESRKLQFRVARKPTVALKQFLTPDIIEMMPKSLNHYEIAPRAGAIVEQMTNFITENGGLILLIDYGHLGDKGDTLRGFKDHKLVEDVLEYVGNSDVTADVNFAYLRQIAAKNALVYGPVSQREFLLSLGLEARYKQLHSKAKNQTELDYLERGFRLLTSPSEMGDRFKVMAVFPKVLEPYFKIASPLGFSGFS